MSVDAELAEMMSAVFAAHREQHQPGEGIAELWGRLGELGLVRLTGSEESGGQWRRLGRGRRTAARGCLARGENPAGRT